MKKYFCLLLFFSLVSFTRIGNIVYVCDSKGAKKFHYTEDCRGLNACKHQIVKTTEEDAKASGLTFCSWE